MKPAALRMVLRASEVAALPETVFRHPLNPAASAHLRSLDAVAGLARLRLNLVRIAPGADAFAPHFHHGDEEFVHVLAGRAVAELGDDSFELAAGDWLLFPAAGPVHHLRNPFDAELLCLMGAAAAALDVAEFPRLGKAMLRIGEQPPRLVDLATAQPFTSRSTAAD